MKQKDNLLLSVDGIKVGEIYTITDGWHIGKKILVDYINPFKTICSNGKQYRQVHGRLLNTTFKINTELELLLEYKNANTNYRNLSNLELIKLAKINDKKAITEFVIRFKKLPNIKRNER